MMPDETWSPSVAIMKAAWASHVKAGIHMGQ